MNEARTEIREQVDAVAQNALRDGNGAELVTELVSSLATILAMAPAEKRAKTRALMEELIGTMFDAASRIGND
jgi:hypothetical protein